MALLNVANDAFSTLAAGITSTATSLTVATGEGARFPASNFHITIGSEILLCSTRAGDVFTLGGRGREGTTAVAHLAGAAVELKVTAQTITQLYGSITSGWELIRTGTFTADTNITGLDGNADRLWKLLLRARRTTALFPSIRFNTDSGFNYNPTRHRVGRSGGLDVHDVVIPTAQSSILLVSTGFNEAVVEVLIFSESNEVRKVVWNGLEWTNASNFFLNSGADTWSDVINNITTINIITGAITSGEYWLFRRRV